MDIIIEYLFRTILIIIIGSYVGSCYKINKKSFK